MQAAEAQLSCADVDDLLSRFGVDLSSTRRTDAASLALYQRALTDRSAASSRGLSNERLEYLGDAVLYLVVASYLCARYPGQQEGFLSRIRSKVVSGRVLADLCRAQLPAVLARVRTLRPGVQADDVLEALLGAVFTDRGFDTASTWFVSLMESGVDFASLVAEQDCPKALLNRHCLRYKGYMPVSETLAPGVVRLLTPARDVIAVGRGRDHEAAERDAFNRALQYFDPPANAPSAAASMMNAVSSAWTQALAKKGAVVVLVVVALLLIVVVVAYIAWRMTRSALVSTTVLKGPRRLNNQNSAFVFSSSRLPAAGVGQRYSFSFWLYLTNFQPTTQGQLLLSRSTQTSSAPNGNNPLVFLDPAVNRMYICVATTRTGSPLNTLMDATNTHGATFLTGTVDYVPLQRWVNYVFTVQDALLTVYQDGSIYSVQSLYDLYDPNNAVPRPNFAACAGDVNIGNPMNSTSADAIGFIARVNYFNYGLTTQQVKKLYASGPTNNSMLFGALSLPEYGLRSPIYSLNAEDESVECVLRNIKDISTTLEHEHNEKVAMVKDQGDAVMMDDMDDMDDMDIVVKGGDLGNVVDKLMDVCDQQYLDLVRCYQVMQRQKNRPLMEILVFAAFSKEGAVYEPIRTVLDQLEFPSIALSDASLLERWGRQSDEDHCIHDWLLLYRCVKSIGSDPSTSKECSALCAALCDTVASTDFVLMVQLDSEDPYWQEVHSLRLLGLKQRTRQCVSRLLRVLKS
ncbi:hypothetical protein CEUSTIGMA_g11937.t1 [Chlamydomonas eustigma]|uniref:RNase III domain-containing protein n=1 Tax=Chlamydomonas eustigma TaxID=1157962 RepID=A0A250XN69_9CHLO|nr:hypothetical protein CEUSTIGMA_g11937.t1 [Chlamydomonas eustigma]|eukprot:GAX84517.1 hypothetical protein CEUSTIGMA_g11937.t1 [Chlamydomonas eustigma]